MVINIRGTGGSGKSHLVKSVMGLYDEIVPQHIEGRKQPISYSCVKINHERRLFVPGHYETATGGCDNIQKIDDAYDLVTDAVVKGQDVIFEGIIVQDDVTRFVALSKHVDARVVLLDTPLEECLKGIQDRRDARGDTKELNPKNTVDRHNRLRKSMVPRLKDANVMVYTLSRGDAFKQVRIWLQV